MPSSTSIHAPQKQQSHPEASLLDPAPDCCPALPLVPAPWSLRGEAWWFLLSVFGKMRERVGGRGHECTGLSSAHFDELEKSSRKDAMSLGAFRGGMGSVQLVRYHQSPVGPYDELLMAPGKFRVSPEVGGPSTAFRVTRIYVSTLDSVLNGRKNWNIAKHLARFEFLPSPNSTNNEITVNVYAMQSFKFEASTSKHGWVFEPCFSKHPFFSVTIQDRISGFGLRMNLNKIPFLNFRLCQPPIEAAEPEYPSDGEKNCGLVGQSDWKAFTPSLLGKAGVCSFKGALSPIEEQFGDGKSFPDIIPYRYGLHWKTLDMVFPPATTSARVQNSQNCCGKLHPKYLWKSARSHRFPAHAGFSKLETDTCSHCIKQQ